MRFKNTYSHRIELLHQMRENRMPDAPDIPEEVLIFMASKISKNIRTLQKGFICLQVYSAFSHTKITIEEANEILAGILD